jgi:hypothetical protein
MNKTAAIREALEAAPEGMDYDALAAESGVPRREIAAFVKNMETRGEIERDEAGGRRVFRLASADGNGAALALEVTPLHALEVPAFIAAKPKGTAMGDRLSAPVPKRRELAELALEAVLSAAAQLAAALRENVEIAEGDALDRALKGFALAERIYALARAA